MQGRTVVIEVLISALLDDLTLAHDQNMIEVLGEVAAAERPDQCPAFELLEQAVDNGSLLAWIEWAHRIIQNEDIRMFEKSTRQSELLPLGKRQPGTGDADFSLQSSFDHLTAQIKIGENLTDQIADFFLGLGLTKRDFSEQDIVLDGRTGVVAIGIEEGDGVLQILRQSLAEPMPRRDDARLQLLIQKAEAVSCRDELEGQGQQAEALGLAQHAKIAAIDLADQGPIVGQILGADEAELPEIIVIRRQIGKQFDHGAGETVADIDKHIGKLALLEHVLHIVL